MYLSAAALATLAEYKARIPTAGGVRDDELERELSRASLEIETYLDRRLVYRGPLEVETADNTVAERQFQNEALAPGPSITQPDAAGRTFVVTFTDADRSITAGGVTITGTVAGVPGQTETFRPMDGDRIHGRKFFSAVSAIDVAGVAGAGAADKYKIGTSIGYEEFHTVSPCSAQLATLDYPIVNVGEVNEDLGRLYAPATALVLGDGYELVKGRGWIRRVTGGQFREWLEDVRAVKLRYSAGYTLATVPVDLKGTAIELAALHAESVGGKRPLGMAAHSDATGNFTRFGPAALTSSMKDALAAYCRPDVFFRTGERDWFEAAA